MSIRHNNELLLSLKPDGGMPSITVDGRPLLVKDFSQDDLRDLPVVLKCGAISYEIGYVSRVRIGREEIYGDLILKLTGSLKFENILNEENEIIGTRPLKYEFVMQ